MGARMPTRPQIPTDFGWWQWRCRWLCCLPCGYVLLWYWVADGWIRSWTNIYRLYYIYLASAKWTERDGNATFSCELPCFSSPFICFFLFFSCVTRCSTKWHLRLTSGSKLARTMKASLVWTAIRVIVWAVVCMPCMKKSDWWVSCLSIWASWDNCLTNNCHNQLLYFISYVNITSILYEIHFISCFELCLHSRIDKIEIE